MPGHPFSFANLRDTGEALFGRQWQPAICRELKLQPRTIAGWFQGKPLPDLRNDVAAKQGGRIKIEPAPKSGPKFGK
jgi:hypothetical protein